MPKFLNCAENATVYCPRCENKYVSTCHELIHPQERQWIHSRSFEKENQLEQSDKLDQLEALTNRLLSE